MYNKTKVEIAEEIFGEMRDLTEEEYKEYIEYINSISEPVKGRTIWEILDEFMGR